MTQQVNTLPTTAVDELKRERNGNFTLNVIAGWRNFFNQILMICGALTQSGTTTERPSTNLWLGRMYWDTDLAFPVWWNGTTWVDSLGAPA